MCIRDSRWEGRIVIGHKENGDPIFRYLYAETQKELTAKLRQNITAYQGVEMCIRDRIKKVAISTYIITPYNVDILGDLIDELENNGLYF